jgi:hypothetical protein
MEPKKLEKLIHYSERPLKTFAQYDVFINMEPNSDDVMTSDSDGDSMTCGTTQELMNSSTVRVLILPNTPKGDILRALKKIRRWIKRDGLFNDEFIRQEIAELDLSKSPF